MTVAAKIHTLIHALDKQLLIANKASSHATRERLARVACVLVEEIVVLKR